MMVFRLALLALGSLPSAVLGACSLTCEAGATCYSEPAPAFECLYNIPFNEDWAVATIDTLTQSLENFGFGPLYHHTGPPYSIELDVMGELANTLALVEGDSFAYDFDFQEHVQSILTATLDAHTRYQKPVCYGVTFLQPIVFNLELNATSDTPAEPKAYLYPSTYAAEYAKVFKDVDITSILNKQVTLVNGIEFTTEISEWGTTHETRSNNPSARFNAALRSYLYRSAVSLNLAPLDTMHNLNLTFADGSTATLPWLAKYAAGFGDVDECLAVEETSSAAPSGRRLMHLDDDMDLTLGATQTAAMPFPRDDRELIVPFNDTFSIGCFIQTSPARSSNADYAAAGVKRTLVMRVVGFSPPGEYIDAWTGFLNSAQQCLSQDFDLIVVDVMQNGGGYVCLGLRLLELLVEDYNDDHTKVQMHYDLPHSKLMDVYIEEINSPNPYINPQDVEEILDPATQKPFPDGRAYYYPGRNVTQGGVMSWRTNWFSLNCQEAEVLPKINGIVFRPPKFMPPEKLVILTDGTCGSTCASFTKIPQEAGKATFYGAGGLWDQSMDVSSFAGGFVCNPGYLQNIATMSGVTFPKFLTEQRWQFGWAAWYSAKLPSRPVQFTEQDPDYRVPFWDFAHPSVNATFTNVQTSSLYDTVISETVTRLAANVVEDCDDVPVIWPYWTAIAIEGLLILIGVLYIVKVKRDSRATFVSTDHQGSLLKGLKEGYRW